MTGRERRPTGLQSRSRARAPSAWSPTTPGSKLTQTDLLCSGPIWTSQSMSCGSGLPRRWSSESAMRARQPRARQLPAAAQVPGQAARPLHLLHLLSLGPPPGRNWRRRRRPPLGAGRAVSWRLLHWPRPPRSPPHADKWEGRGLARCHLVVVRFQSRPSNRACGSPAHGLPTLFTDGIRSSHASPGRVWAQRRFHRG